METKTKLCCLLSPSYICSSCGFRECLTCVNKLPGTHFKASGRGDRGERCRITGKIMKLRPGHSVGDSWVWEEVDE